MTFLEQKYKTHGNTKIVLLKDKKIKNYGSASLTVHTLEIFSISASCNYNQGLKTIGF